MRTSSKSRAIRSAATMFAAAFLISVSFVAAAIGPAAALS